MANHVVIMAGGIGSRFWPMSTEKKPKQFIDIMGCGRTLLQLTADRFKGICCETDVWVVTNKLYKNLVKEQLPNILDDHILIEPCRRNTAPCIAYASFRIKHEDPHANIVVTPSDHIVMYPTEFQRIISNCLHFTNESDTIVTLGIPPTRPETGYGYIQANFRNATVRNKEIFPVYSFHEKPDAETAKEYINQKNYLWNSGIFIWQAETIVNAFRIYQPNMARIFENLMPYYGTDKEQDMIDQYFPDCENISVDYAIMEKVDEIYVSPANCGWSDLGTWGSLLQQSQKDVYGNALIGQMHGDEQPSVKVFDCQNCIIHTMEEKQVIVQGLDGYIIAEQDDTLLICKLSEEQRIKEFH